MAARRESTRQDDFASGLFIHPDAASSTFYYVNIAHASGSPFSNPHFQTRWLDEDYVQRTRYLVLRNNLPPKRNDTSRYRRTAASELRVCDFTDPFVLDAEPCGSSFLDDCAYLHHWASHFDGPNSECKTVYNWLTKYSLMPVFILERILSEMKRFINHPCVYVPLMGPCLSVLWHVRFIVDCVALHRGALISALLEDDYVKAFFARLRVWVRSLADVGTWCHTCGEILECKVHEAYHLKRCRGQWFPSCEPFERAP